MKRHGCWVRGWWPWFVLGLEVLAVGCGGETKLPVGEGEAGADAVGEPPLASSLPSSKSGTGLPSDGPPGVGWSNRSLTPGGGTLAKTAVDSNADRLLIVGRKELWSLALSGPNQERWQALPLDTSRTPAEIQDVVYDPSGKRVLATVDAEKRSELWELALQPEPHWKPLIVYDANLDIQPRPPLALDAEGNRVFALRFVATGSCDVLSAPLDEQPQWQSITSDSQQSLPCPFGHYPYGIERIVYDSPRDRLLAFSDREAWALPLAERQWSKLASAECPLPFDIASSTYDPVAQEVVFTLGGSSSRFSLVRDTWVCEDAGPSGVSLAGSAFDGKRERILYFSGLRDDSLRTAGNATWWQASGSDRIAPLTPNTRGECLPPEAAVAWDPIRQLVVSANDDGSANAFTLVHGADVGALWTQSSLAYVDEELSTAAVYATSEDAVVTFGGALPRADQSLNPLARVRRLASTATQWEDLSPEPGPSGRYQHVGVYDSKRDRLLVHGGMSGAFIGSAPYDEAVDDTWALSLAATPPVWEQLSTHLPARPGAVAAEHPFGVYDAEGDRLIVGDGDALGVRPLQALSVGDDPEWTPLETSGEPPALQRPAVVYDPDGRRMILIQVGKPDTTVAALSLDGAPTWHTFCSLGTPPTGIDARASVVLTTDGLLVLFGDAAYRFDLATPYCD